MSISDSKWAFAPNILFNTSYNLSNGRVLDETTYEFVTNRVIGSSSSSISASILLFDGMKNLRQLKLSKLNREVATLKYRKTEKDLFLYITACFLETLCAQENIKNYRSLVETLKTQEELISTKVNHGKVTAVDLLQIQAKRTEAENTLLSSEHSYELARMNLCQALGLNDYNTFVPTMSNADSLMLYHLNRIELLSMCEYLPELALAKKNIEISKQKLLISKAQYFPTISLQFGYISSFSNARQKVLQNEDGSYEYQLYPFWEQYKDNSSQYISLGVRIPIFNNLSVNSQKKMKLEIKRNEYAYSTTKQTIEKELIQLMMDVETAWNKFQVSKQYLTAAQEVVRQITLKFEAGTIDVFSYREAISSLIEAQTQYLTTKYEYIFKNKVISIYQNHIPL